MKPKVDAFTVTVERGYDRSGFATVVVSTVDDSPAELWRVTVRESDDRGATRRALQATKRWLVGWLYQGEAL